jgi:uncharacterized protein
MAQSYRGPIVDVDLHHGWKTAADIVEYLPKRWQEYATASGIPAGPRTWTSMSNTPDGARRKDSYPADGSPPGSDYATLKEQILDRHNFYRAILSYNVGSHSNLENRDFSVAVSRAVHEWNAEKWLTVDERLYSVICPPTSVPDEAAKEIRRAGAHPRVIATLLAGSPLNRPFGDPVYHPIYKATVDMGLVLHIHPGGQSADRPPGGIPTSGTQGAAMYAGHEALHHLTSFIVHGVFEKYPGLRVLVKEHGVAWLPYLMWRLDKNYELLKLESPWVKRWPSEYIMEHFQFDTQPLEEGPRRDDTRRVFTSVDGIENILCFGTDYPHITSDDPAYVVRHLPQEWVRKVMCDNACAFHGWTPPPDYEAHARRVPAATTS